MDAIQISHIADVSSAGREIGSRNFKNIARAVRLVFGLAAFAIAGTAAAQGGICQSNCGDQLGGWVITPPGDSGGWQIGDPCSNGGCTGGGGNNVPPDEGGSGGTRPGGSSGSGSNEVQHVHVTAADCSTMEELRLAAVNAQAVMVVRSADEGDTFRVTYVEDEKEEVWEFMCGGRFCGPTVLKPSPISSQCN